ncbi:MAG: cupredoxin domain-containing protein [Candidatus Peribacteria bacterium]|nr:MAG: cupredoxin domain-containing protein [Candidatus Peribacteria bacterium]
MNTTTNFSLKTLLLVALWLCGIVLSGCTKAPAATDADDAVMVDDAAQNTDVEDAEDEDVADAEEANNVETGDVVGPNDPAPVVVFEVSGRNFAYSTDTIEVPLGSTVTINFTSTDGFHDWVVDEFGAATEKVNPGTPTSVTFVADKAGEYEYYCSVGQHRANGMVGKLIVK